MPKALQKARKNAWKMHGHLHAIWAFGRRPLVEARGNARARKRQSGCRAGMSIFPVAGSTRARPPEGGGRRIQARKRDHGARPAGKHARKFRTSLPGVLISLEDTYAKIEPNWIPEYKSIGPNLEERISRADVL